MVRVESINTRYVDTNKNLSPLNGIVITPDWYKSNKDSIQFEIEGNKSGKIETCGYDDMINYLRNNEVVAQSRVVVDKSLISYFICPWSREAVEASKYIDFDGGVSVESFVAGTGLRSKVEEINARKTSETMFTGKEYAWMNPNNADVLCFARDRSLSKARVSADKTGYCTTIGIREHKFESSNVVDFIMRCSNNVIWCENNKVAVYRYLDTEGVAQSILTVFKYSPKFLKFILASS